MRRGFTKPRSDGRVRPAVVSANHACCRLGSRGDTIADTHASRAVGALEEVTRDLRVPATLPTRRGSSLFAGGPERLSQSSRRYGAAVENPERTI
jgi:hypothetical protein